MSEAERSPKANPREDDFEWMVFAAMIRNAITEAVFGCRPPLGPEWAKRAETRERSKAEALDWFYSKRFGDLCAVFNCSPRVVRLQPLKTIAENRENPKRYINWE